MIITFYYSVFVQLLSLRFCCSLCFCLLVSIEDFLTSVFAMEKRGIALNSSISRYYSKNEEEIGPDFELVLTGQPQRLSSGNVLANERMTRDDRSIISDRSQVS